MTNMIIEPREPWQNGTNESFNGSFTMSPSHHWFKNRRHAKLTIELVGNTTIRYDRTRAWVTRPHSSSRQGGNVSTTEARILVET